MLLVEDFQKFAGIPFGISRIFESLMPQQISANRRKNRSIQVQSQCREDMMIKTLFCFIIAVTLFIFLSHTLVADVGIKGGIGFFNLTTTNYLYGIISGPDLYAPDPKNIMSFQLGAFFSFDISKYFAFQTEIYYVIRGTRTSEYIDAIGKEIKLKLKVDYLEIPFLLKYKIPLGKMTRPIIFFGPYLGLRRNARSFYEGLFRKIVEVDYNPAIKNQYAGLIVGGGFEFNLKSMTLILEGRYTFGITGINDMNSPIPREFITEISKYPTHQSFVLMIGIGI
jgi:hypothetical protein